MKQFIIGFIALILVFAFAIGTCNGDSMSEEELTAFVNTEEPAVSEPNENTATTSEQPQVSEPRALDSKTITLTQIPEGTPSQILVREGYVTSYNNDTKCPNWVAWQLTSEHTDGPYPRSGAIYYDEDGNALGIGRLTPEIARGDYIVDMEAQWPRQEIDDWDKSIPNNSHGHMCPAGDNKWSREAMNQSFLLTNMCPQDKDLNANDWEGLERRCRGWARRYGEVSIVTGPVFDGGKAKRTMGKNLVAVPDAFFKVVLCLNGSVKALGFLFPNNSEHHELEEYQLPIDEIERLTGFDFFPELPDDIETVVEATSNLREWI